MHRLFQAVRNYRNYGIFDNNFADIVLRSTVSKLLNRIFSFQLKDSFELTPSDKSTISCKYIFELLQIHFFLLIPYFIFNQLSIDKQPIPSRILLGLKKVVQFNFNTVKSFVFIKKSERFFFRLHFPDREFTRKSARVKTVTDSWQRFYS